MLSINTNLPSLTAQSSLNNSTKLLNQAIERMSTGFKLNHASDNAANYSISTNMATQLSSYQVAEDNVAGGLDLLATADGALSLIGDKLSRLRALAEQAANGTYGGQSLNAINREANAIVDEIERLYNTTEYNGINLFRDETAPAARISTFSLDSGRSVDSSHKFVNEITRIDTTSLIAMSDVPSITRGNTYAINNIDDLKKLSEYVNRGDDTTGTTFVLGSDIDFSGVNDWTPIASTAEILNNWETQGFKGTFDGNGYSIKNMSADDSTATNIDGTLFYSLFGVINSGTVKNLGIDKFVYQHTDSTTNAGSSPLAFTLYNGTIDNCYTQNVTLNTVVYSGGLTSVAMDSFIKNSYVNGFNCDTGFCIGGLNGFQTVNTEITNCCVNLGSVTNCTGAGGITHVGENITLTECSIFTEHPEQLEGLITAGIGGDNVLAGSLTLSQEIIDYMYYTAGSAEYIYGNKGADSSIDDSGVNMVASTFANYLNNLKSPVESGGDEGGSGGHNSFSPDSIIFQVGINSNQESQIGLKTSFKLPEISSLRRIGLNTATDFLGKIDNLTNTISAKQTEYGAAQNRLESALDEISTRFENLASSRSTLRDADIAEVSSQYIQQQILQQASATLLATANQSPALALQLL